MTRHICRLGVPNITPPTFLEHVGAFASLQIAFGEVKDEIKRAIEPKRQSSSTKLASPKAALERIKKIGSPLHPR